VYLSWASQRYPPRGGYPGEPAEKPFTRKASWREVNCCSYCCAQDSEERRAFVQAEGEREETSVPDRCAGKSQTQLQGLPFGAVACPAAVRIHCNRTHGLKLPEAGGGLPQPQ
jgi:hypothetical protein